MNQSDQYASTMTIVDDFSETWIWSEKIDAYANRTVNTFLALPSVTASGGSTVCGESVEIFLAVENGALKYAIKAVGSKLCRASAALIHDRLERASLEQSIEIVGSYRRFLEDQWKSCEAEGFRWMDATIPKNLLNSIMLPWHVMELGLKRLPNASNEAIEASSAFDPMIGLTCDACLVMSAILAPTRERKSASEQVAASRFEALRRILRAFIALARSKRPDPRECSRTIGRFGLLYLPNSVRSELQSFASRITDREIDYLRRIGLIKIFASHLKTLHSNNGSRHLNLQLSHHDQHVVFTNSVTKIVSDIADKRNVNIRFIKGTVTKELYDLVGCRSSKDVDVLGQNFPDLCVVAQSLIRNHGFSFSRADSVPLSLKIVRDHSGKDLLTGHFHLEKILFGFPLVVDLAFPGIPVGQTSAIGFPKGPRAAPTDWHFILLVTLTHLFKHHFAPIKDLNDLSLICSQHLSQIDTERMRDEIDTHGLVFQSQLAMWYLVSSGMLSSDNPVAKRLLADLSWKRRCLIRGILKLNWPFKPYSHLIAQTIAELERQVKAGEPGRFRYFKALDETSKLILKEGMTPVCDDTSDLRALGMNRFERNYLTPVYLTNKLLCNETLSRLNLCQAVIQGRLPKQSMTILIHGRTKLLLTPIGLFQFLPKGFLNDDAVRSWHRELNFAETLEPAAGW